MNLDTFDLDALDGEPVDFHNAQFDDDTLLLSEALDSFSLVISYD